MCVDEDPPLTLADGDLHELIDGVEYVSNCSTFTHQTPVMNLLSIFGDYLKLNPIGDFTFGVGVIFDAANEVIPDFVYFSRERRKHILKGERLSGAPEIVIEILLPGASNELRDRQVKRALYSTRGVDEYWIVDPESHTVEIHRKRKEGGLELIGSLQENDDLTSPLLPGFRTQVATLFEI